LLASAWWESQILELGAKWQETIRDLAARMRTDSQRVDEQSERSALRDGSERLLHDAAELDTMDRILEKLDGLESSGRVSASATTPADSIQRGGTERVLTFLGPRRGSALRGMGQSTTTLGGWTQPSRFRFGVVVVFL
jgi:hypothetical protein